MVSIPNKDKKLHLVPDESVLLISCCVRTGGQGRASGVGEQRPIYFGKAPLPVLFISFTCGSDFSQTVLSLLFKCTFLKGTVFRQNHCLLLCPGSRWQILNLSSGAACFGLDASPNGVCFPEPRPPNFSHSSLGSY